MRKINYDPDSPYAGLIEFAKPDDPIKQKKQMEKLAKLNALTEAFRLIGEGFYGRKGAFIPQRQPQQTALYALDRYNQLDQEYRNMMQNWRNLSMQIAVEDQRLRDTRTWQEGQTERAQGFSAEEAEKQRRFAAGQTQQGQSFQEKVISGEQRFQTERETVRHERDLEKIEKQGEWYKDRLETTGTNKPIKLASGAVVEAPYIGYALSLIRDKYNTEVYITKDKLLKNFLKDEKTLSYDEKAELLNRYWDGIKDSYSQAVGDGKTVVAPVQTGNRDSDITNIWINTQYTDGQKYAFTVDYLINVLNYDPTTADVYATKILQGYKQNTTK